jgi:hypothetical protein
VIRNDSDREALVKLAHNMIQKFDKTSTGQPYFPGLEFSYKPKDKLAKSPENG